jgi:ketosteroid isomerase-like protein
MHIPHQCRPAHTNLAGLLLVALTGVQTAMAQPPADVPIGKAPVSDAVAPDTGAIGVALEGFRRLQVGAATGDWAPFEAMLADDVTFYAPVEGFDGVLRGKSEARRLFAHHAAATRTTWTLMRTLANGNEIGFEARAEGDITGRPGYSNNLFMVLRIDGGQIKQFREYAASTGYKTHQAGRGAFDYLRK